MSEEERFCLAGKHDDGSQKARMQTLGPNSVRQLSQKNQRREREKMNPNQAWQKQNQLMRIESCRESSLGQNLMPSKSISTTTTTTTLIIEVPRKVW
jgi:hypothetical protein